MENLRKSLLKLLSSDGRNGAHSWGGVGNFASSDIRTRKDDANITTTHTLIDDDEDWD